MNDDTKPKRARGLRRAVVALLGAIALVLVLEGALSLGSMMLAVSRQARPVPADHRHTAHDQVLGWKAAGGLTEDDAYGEWRPLTTTRDGLRASRQPSTEAEDGVFRLLCSGGSPVFGVGVADDETWCARIGARSTRVEAVNVAQPAHGPGQAWLMLRDRVAMNHDLLVFALSAPDMFKLVNLQDDGFPKPRLVPGESGLEIENTPMPGRPFLFPWVTYNASLFARSHLLAPLVFQAERTRVENPALAASAVATELIPELRQWVEGRQAGVAVVYLPSHPAYRPRARIWRETLARELELRGLPFIDLTDNQGATLSAPPEELFGQRGQLTAQAHQQIADALAAELPSLEGVDMPALSGGPWRARYFSDAVFQNQVAVRRHGVSAFEWGAAAPMPELPNDGFGVVMDSCLPLDGPQRIRVRLEADGPATFSVNQQAVLETGEGEGPLHRVNAVELPAGNNHLRIRYRDSADRASLRLIFRFEDGRVTTPGPDLLRAPTGKGCPGGGAGDPAD